MNHLTPALTHDVRITGGYDCIRFECKFDSPACKPGAGGSHGLHGVGLVFVVSGSEGAVAFSLYTGWLPQSVRQDGIMHRHVESWTTKESAAHYPMPADLGYHSRKHRYEGQTVCQEECGYLGGDPCYYDGSGLNANDAMYAMVNGGGDALWTFLEGYYKCTFGDGEYPQPAEYPKPLRIKKTL